MRPTGTHNLFAQLLLLLALASIAQASGGAATSHVRFTWTTDGQPAAVTLPLPAGLEPAQVEGASLPGNPGLVGIGLEADPPRLELYLQPPAGEILDFSVVDLRLDSGAQRRFEFGHATVVSLESRSGPLRFERSLAAPAAGLYQAVALRNAGEAGLSVTAASYLPAPLEEGRLLVAKGRPVELLTRLESTMSPARRREAQRLGNGYPQLKRFEWREAGEVDLTLAPGETGVLVWTDAAFPTTAPRMSYELEPVIEYRTETEAAALKLGLPVTVRRRP